jgi:hypothetical protein
LFDADAAPRTKPMVMRVLLFIGLNIVGITILAAPYLTISP